MPLPQIHHAECCANHVKNVEPMMHRAACQLVCIMHSCQKCVVVGGLTEIWIAFLIILMARSPCLIDFVGAKSRASTLGRPFEEIIVFNNGAPSLILAIAKALFSCRSAKPLF